ncbi:hypothetical protein UZ36_05590 [Candidatus Nitromaritima sp. SCGC AAA799-C22]|nr:hypothetical protein UZ36_05590 [Candidatus Nitromaritima sp. SCGC AAA799-C22]
MMKPDHFIKILAAQILAITLLLSIIEGAGQIYAYLRPGYETLSAIPDKLTGWRPAPNLSYIYTGTHWYEREFRVEIKHNSQGFRDTERRPVKPSNTTRAVLLGDSFVEAKEVSFQNTPGQILEQLLNSNQKLAQNKNWEILNFGVGGFGIGQSFLTYRGYAKEYSPDYVFLFIFEGDIWRTVHAHSAITNNINPSQKIPIRPVFYVDERTLDPLLNILNFKSFYKLLVYLNSKKAEGQPINFPTEEEYIQLIKSQTSLVTSEKIKKISDELAHAELKLFMPKQTHFDTFTRLQNERLNQDMRDNRGKIRDRQLFIRDLWNKMAAGSKYLKTKLFQQSAMKEEFETLLEIYAPKVPNDLFSGSQDFPNFERIVLVNLKILEVLNTDIKNDGGKLIIVDASPHLVKYGRLPATLLSTILQHYSHINGMGYIPLYRPLLDAKNKGLRTRWANDGHFNETGYQIFGEAMYRWIMDNPESQ